MLMYIVHITQAIVPVTETVSYFAASWQAIRDGVIEATIDHEQGYVQSKEMSDIYGTKEPMTAFHQRITFCLDLHNNSVKVACCRLRVMHTYVML